MPTFTFKVREAGQLLGETEVSLPELTFVPETAIVHMRADGRETPLLGWGSRLWARMHEPAKDASGDRKPLTPESFARLANEETDGNPFGAQTLSNPFNPNRFSHPLAVSRQASKTTVLDARLKEVRAASRGLAVIEGVVHRAVPEPVYVVGAGPGVVRLEAMFREDAAHMPAITWNVFRADRSHDAEAFASEVAALRGHSLLDPAGWLRVVYSQILKVDDVGEAFAEAFRRYLTLGLPDPLGLGTRIAALPPELSGPAAADEAQDILADVRQELERTLVPGGDMRHEAALEVCGLVASRYASVDRDWLESRAAAPVFAP
jgi:hypothetical protein